MISFLLLLTYVQFDFLKNSYGLYLLITVYKEPHLITSSKDREKQNDFEQFLSTFKDAR